MLLFPSNSFLFTIFLEMLSRLVRRKKKHGLGFRCTDVINCLIYLFAILKSEKYIFLCTKFSDSKQIASQSASSENKSLLFWGEWMKTWVLQTRSFSSIFEEKFPHKPLNLKFFLDRRFICHSLKEHTFAFVVVKSPLIFFILLFDAFHIGCSVNGKSSF